MSSSIEAEDVTYPDKPDANGYAKRYYKRRAFYFGTFNTPESLKLFAEWKRQLIETGAAPDVKTVRKDLAHSRPSVLQTPAPRSVFWPSVIGALIVGATILLGAQILSSTMAPSVDGIVLSEYEKDAIRGMRNVFDTLEKSNQDPERIANRNVLLERAIEAGPEPEPLHESKRYPANAEALSD